MKKFLRILTMAFFVSIAFESSGQPPHAKAYGKRNKEWKHHHKHHVPVVVKKAYYYYPSANVYYSPIAHRYWYPRSGVWVSVGRLPSTYVIVNKPRYEVYYGGDEVWRENVVHIRRYSKPRVSVQVRANF